MRTDTSEKGLESLIVADMTVGGWSARRPDDYNREYAVDLVQLRAFLTETQPAAAEALDLGNDSPVRQKFWPGFRARYRARGSLLRLHRDAEEQDPRTVRPHGRRH